MPADSDMPPSLDMLLAAYERALTRALAAPPPHDLREADACFASLRASVASRWPPALHRLDALGLAANDLLDAAAAGQDLVASHTAHARALFDMRVALLGAAREIAAMRVTA